MAKPTMINGKNVPCNQKFNCESDHHGRKGLKTGDQVEIKIKQCNRASRKIGRSDKGSKNGTTEPEDGPMEIVNAPCDSGIYSTNINNEGPLVLKNDAPSWRKNGGGRPKDALASAQFEEHSAQPDPDFNGETNNENCTRSKIDQKIEVKSKPYNTISYKRRRPDQEYARCVKFILLAVIICYTPSSSLYLYSIITKDTNIPEYIAVYTHGGALLNSTLNAVIFLICNKDFQRFTKNFPKSVWSKFLHS